MSNQMMSTNIEIAKADLSSKAKRDEFIQLILKNNLQEELYHEIKKHDSPQGNRLAWSLTVLSEIDNQWIIPLIDDMITWIPAIKTQGIHRSLLRTVAELPLSKKKDGEWVDFCFSLLENNKTDVAVEVHAMTILYKYCAVYPELANELIVILEDKLPFYSAAGKARARKILSKLK
ncbi:hypothetical protein [Flammeovirga sp. SubArs3]|uniref:hypothetical protein n=1 Tax=Flammeovirga sp. SubArs3 TaxID=2995316 RepID=UPI00248AB94B|nr:hypothetical protein [Flammeovirga sp. SubArs3]